MTEFWAMGGYAAYVWPAYGLVTVLLVGFALHAAHRYAQARRRSSLLEGDVP